MPQQQPLLSADVRPSMRESVFSKLTSRHPLVVQAAILLLEDPYIPGKGRLPIFLSPGPLAVSELDEMLYNRFLGDEDEYLKIQQQKYLLPVSKDTKRSMELFRDKALTVEEIKDYLPLIYKIETMARNAFLSYNKLEACRIWMFRWWLFIAIQRQVVDKLIIRKDGTVTLAGPSFMRSDLEQLRDDNEISYYRQCVRRGLLELSDDWKWLNMLNFQIRRPIRVFAEGKWQPPCWISEKQQVECLCELNLLVRLLQDEKLMPDGLLCIHKDSDDFIFKNSFALDKKAVERNKIRQGQPDSHKDRFGKFVSVIEERKKKNAENVYDVQPEEQGSSPGGKKKSTTTNSNSPNTNSPEPKVFRPKTQNLQYDSHLPQLDPETGIFKKWNDISQRWVGGAICLEHPEQGGYIPWQGGPKIPCRQLPPLMRFEHRKKEVQRVNLFDASGDNGRRELDKLCSNFESVSKLDAGNKTKKTDVMSITYPRYKFPEVKDTKKITIDMDKIAENCLIQMKWIIVTQRMPSYLKGVCDVDIKYLCPPQHLIVPDDCYQEILDEDDPVAQERLENLEKHGPSFMYSLVHRCPKYTIDRYEEPRSWELQQVREEDEEEDLTDVEDEDEEVDEEEEDEKVEGEAREGGGTAGEGQTETQKEGEGGPGGENSESESAAGGGAGETGETQQTTENPNGGQDNSNNPQDPDGNNIVSNPFSGGIATVTHAKGIAGKLMNLGKAKQIDRRATGEDLEGGEEDQQDRRATLDDGDGDNNIDFDGQQPQVTVKAVAIISEQDITDQDGNLIDYRRYSDSEARGTDSEEDEALTRLKGAMNQMQDDISDGVESIDPEAMKYDYDQIENGFGFLKYALEFNKNIQQSALVLTAFPFAIRLHPKTFIYGSSFFLTTALNAGYGNRLRYLSLQNCVEVESRVLRTIMRRCLNLMVLDISGIVRENVQYLRQWQVTERKRREDFKKQDTEVVTRALNQIKQGRKWEVVLKDLTKSFINSKEDESKRKIHITGFEEESHEKCVDKMNAFAELDFSEFDEHRSPDLFPGIAVDSLCELIEEHPHLQVLICNEARLDISSVVRLCYSVGYLNQHSLQRFEFSDPMDPMGRKHRDKDWDSIMSAVDEYIMYRGERIMDSGEFIANEQSIIWRKQPKVGTTSALQRAGFGKLVPSPIHVGDIQDHMYNKLDLLSKKRIENHGKKAVLSKIFDEFRSSHKLQLHPCIKLMNLHENFEEKEAKKNLIKQQKDQEVQQKRQQFVQEIQEALIRNLEGQKQQHSNDPEYEIREDDIEDIRRVLRMSVSGAFDTLGPQLLNQMMMQQQQNSSDGDQILGQYTIHDTVSFKPGRFVPKIIDTPSDGNSDNDQSPINRQRSSGIMGQEAEMQMIMAQQRQSFKEQQKEQQRSSIQKTLETVGGGSGRKTAMILNVTDTTDTSLNQDDNLNVQSGSLITGQSGKVHGGSGAMNPMPKRNKRASTVNRKSQRQSITNIATTVNNSMQKRASLVDPETMVFAGVKKKTRMSYSEAKARGIPIQKSSQIMGPLPGQAAASVLNTEVKSILKGVQSQNLKQSNVKKTLSGIDMDGKEGLDHQIHGVTSKGSKDNLKDGPSSGFDLTIQRLETIEKKHHHGSDGIDADTNLDTSISAMHGGLGGINIKNLARNSIPGKKENTGKTKPKITGRSKVGVHGEVHHHKGGGLEGGANEENTQTTQSMQN